MHTRGTFCGTSYVTFSIHVQKWLVGTGVDKEEEIVGEEDEEGAALFQVEQRFEIVSLMT